MLTFYVFCFQFVHSLHGTIQFLKTQKQLILMPNHPRDKTVSEKKILFMARIVSKLTITKSKKKKTPPHNIDPSNYICKMAFKHMTKAKTTRDDS